MLHISQTLSFKKRVKKLHKNQKIELDSAIITILKNPSLGEEKKGDLGGVFVYKFKMIHQLTLLAYMFDDTTLTLLELGSYENFYRDLKK